MDEVLGITGDVGSVNSSDGDALQCDFCNHSFSSLGCLWVLDSHSVTDDETFETF